MSVTAAADEGKLLQAVSLYASFDEKVQADVGGGGLTFSTRFNHPTEKGAFVFEKGFNDKIFQIAPKKGIQGGALAPKDVLPDNGRIFLPLRGNLAFKPGGWGGAVSVWINTDPNKLLKTTFCDPIQITQKGANNGGIWFDFNNAKPRRDMRMGLFPAASDGQKGFTEDDPNAPMVKIPGVDFQEGQWHHVVLSWKNFDTGRPDAHGILYVDGKKIGEVKDRAIAMAWDPDKAGIYVAVNYLGLLDELALFSREISNEEVETLYRQPGFLQKLKK